MNVRFVHYYPRAMIGDGGPTISLWAWAGALADRGHKVTILHAGGRATTPLARSGVELIPIKHYGRGRATRPSDLGNHLQPDDILLLHSGYVLHNLMAARQAQRRAAPYIVRPLGAYDPLSKARRRRLKKAWGLAEGPLLKNALGIHVYFDSEKSGATEVSQQARFIVAPTGKTLPKEPAQGGGGYLAWLGRYDVNHKGIDLLLKAVARIDRRDRPRLIMHGRDHVDTRKDVLKITKSLRVDNEVEVLGPIAGDAKEEYLRRADGYVHPSRWESYGNSLVESLAYGIPSLVTTRAHIAPSLERANAAVVVEPTEETLARGVLEVSQAGLEMGRRARQYVQRDLNWDRIVESYLNQVYSLLGD